MVTGPATTKENERGSATILMVAIIGAVMVICSAVLLVARLNTAVAWGSSIADLAALGGAHALNNLGTEPCPVAAEVAGRNDSDRLFAVACTDLGQGRVEVCVTRQLLGYPVRACARAGPDPGS